MENCYACVHRARISEMEICKRQKRIIRISLESGNECIHFEKRLCIMCSFYYFLDAVCSKKEKPEDCSLFIN